jgi:hypothetical protein
MTGSTSREKPIPDDAHGRDIGEYLRALRQAAGSPTYRELASIAKVEHHTLSQTANGQRICGAAAIKQYVDAVRQYADRQGVDLTAAMRPSAGRFQVDPDVDVLDQALAVRTRLESRRRSRATRAADPPVPEQRVPDPPKVPASLSRANALDELLVALREMIADRGWDLTASRVANHHRPVPEYLLGREAQRVLTGRRWLNATVYARILEACGAGYMHGDTFVPYQPDWAAAWHRVRPADFLFVDPPASQTRRAGPVPAIAIPGPTDRAEFLPRSWQRWRSSWQDLRSRQRRAGLGGPADPAQAATPGGNGGTAGPPPRIAPEDDAADRPDPGP